MCTSRSTIGHIQPTTQGLESWCWNMRVSKCLLFFFPLHFVFVTTHSSPSLKEMPKGIFSSCEENFCSKIFKSRKFSRSAFFSAIRNDLRSFHPGTCLNTKTPRAYRFNERFPPAFQVRFPMAMFLTIRLDTAAEETWVRGQFSPCRELYGRSMYNTYAILTETPNQR